MSAIGLTTPARSAGLKKFQLNAGIFLINFDRTGITSESALRSAIATAVENNTGLLGITRGGGSFQVTSEMRTPEFDGQRYSYKGGEFVDSADAFLSTTLLEVTPNNLKYAIGSGSIDETGHIVSMHTQVEESDYIPLLTWVGDLADGGFVLIELKNALNTSGLNITFSDKGEATIPVEYHAHQDELSDYDEAPFKIVFFDGVTNPGVSVYPSFKEIAVNGSVQMSASGYPAGGSTTWASDDTNVATVTSGGLVSGVAAGTVTITATYTKGTDTATGKAIVRVVSAG